VTATPEPAPSLTRSCHSSRAFAAWCPSAPIAANIARQVWATCPSHRRAVARKRRLMRRSAHSLETGVRCIGCSLSAAFIGSGAVHRFLQRAGLLHQIIVPKEAIFIEKPSVRIEIERTPKGEWKALGGGDRDQWNERLLT
jgi:hypothetical protein